MVFLGLSTRWVPCIYRVFSRTYPAETPLPSHVFSDYTSPSNAPHFPQPSPSLQGACVKHGDGHTLEEASVPTPDLLSHLRAKFNATRPAPHSFNTDLLPGSSGGGAAPPAAGAGRRHAPASFSAGGSMGVHRISSLLHGGSSGWFTGSWTSGAAPGAAGGGSGAAGAPGNAREGSEGLPSAFASVSAQRAVAWAHVRSDSGQERDHHDGMWWRSLSAVPRLAGSEAGARLGGYGSGGSSRGGALQYGSGSVSQQASTEAIGRV